MNVGCNREGALARRFYFCAHCLLSYQQALLGACESACLPLLYRYLYRLMRPLLSLLQDEPSQFAQALLTGDVPVP